MKTYGEAKSRKTLIYLTDKQRTGVERMASKRSASIGYVIREAIDLMLLGEELQNNATPQSTQ